MVSRFCPTVVVNGTMLACCTVAVTLFPLLGGVNPDGVPAVSVVLPVCVELAVNVTMDELSPPLNAALVGDTVPTLELLLLIGTLTLKPPRTG